MKDRLRDYRRNVYSQLGEDGVLEEICRRLELRVGSFVEFGAWDGRHLSNTFHLLETAGWRGVYIEMEPSRFAQLRENIRPFADRVSIRRARVEVEGENTLDRLLADTDMPHDFDLLSIDIDSFDWQVWESLRNYRPRIVVIEGNSKIPPGVRQVHQAGEAQGSSFTSLVELGVAKGYCLVCHTGNLIFVRGDLVDRLDMDPADVANPERLFDYQRHHDELQHRSLRRRLNRALFRLRENAAGLKRRMWTRTARTPGGP